MFDARYTTQLLSRAAGDDDDVLGKDEEGEVEESEDEEEDEDEEKDELVDDEGDTKF